MLGLAVGEDKNVRKEGQKMRDLIREACRVCGQATGCHYWFDFESQGEKSKYEEKKSKFLFLNSVCTDASRCVFSNKEERAVRKRKRRAKQQRKQSLQTGDHGDV